MMEATRTCISKYIDFSGRAGRPEYWWFLLFVVVVSMVLSVIDVAIFGTDPETGEGNRLLSSLFQLAMFLPLLAAGWRRLHDSGKPGWYLLLPMLASLLFMVGMMTGVVAFSVMQSQGADPEALRGTAAVLGVTGITVAIIAQILLAILMIWWLTRPSDPGENQYGLPPG